MKHKAAAGFNPSAEVHANLGGHRQRPDAELRQKVEEGDGADQAVDHQPHGAVGMMGAAVDDGAGEAGIAHAGHGDEKLAGEIFSVLHILKSSGPLPSPQWAPTDFFAAFPGSTTAAARRRCPATCTPPPLSPRSH